METHDEMEFDALKDFSDAEYRAFVDWLQARTVADLRASRNSADGVRKAILKYLKSGYRAHLTPQELVDFFCVSSASILDQSDIKGTEAADAVKLFDELSRLTYERYRSS